MKKIFTTFIVGLLGFSALIAQPIAENGFFYNDFSDVSYGGMTYSLGTGSGVTATLTGANITGPGPLVYNVSSTPTTTSGSGYENYVQIAFGKKTGGYFNGSSANLRLNLTSSQSIGVTCLVIISNARDAGDFNGLHIYDNGGVGAIYKSLALSPGTATYNINFGTDPSKVNFSYYSELLVYFVYNYPYASGSASAPAGTLTFNSITFGTSMTGFSLTANDITTTHGVSQVTAAVEPLGIQGTTSFVGLSLSPKVSLSTIDGVSCQLTPTGLQNGTVSVLGISQIYPYLSSTVEVQISENPPAAPTFVGISPSMAVVYKGGNQLLAATLSPVGSSGNFSWTSSDPTKANISASGSGGIGRNALIRVPTTATSGIVTISGKCNSSLGTTTGYAIISVVTSFTITSTGINPILSLNGVNPNDGSNLTGIIWSVLPLNIATVNSITGVLTVKADGVVTLTGVLSGMTIKKVDTVSVTPITGIDGTLTSSSISVYPNPASTVLNVSAQGAEIISVGFVNSIGQTVLTSGSGTISLLGVPKGFYILSVKTTKGSAKKRVLVE